MSVSSDDINILIYRYLLESGFDHTAFTFASESGISSSSLTNPLDLATGALVLHLQKGLQFLQIEAHVNEKGEEVECHAPFTLLHKHECTNATVVAPSSASKRRRATTASGSSITATSGTGSEGGGVDEVKREPRSGTPQLSALPTDKVAVLRGHEGNTSFCSWSPAPGQAVLASGAHDATARLWTVGAGGVSSSEAAGIASRGLVLSHPKRKGAVGEVTAADWSRDGSTLITGAYDGLVRIWSVAGGSTSTPLATLSAHTQPIFSLRLSPGGTSFATSSVDNTVVIFDLARRKLIARHQHHTAPTLDADWRTDTEFASCSQDKTIAFCRVGTPTPLRRYTSHTDEVNCIRWSPHGKVLASCSDDKTVRLWAPDRDEATAVLRGHDREAYAVRWSPKDPLLASASFDTNVRLWDPNTGQCTYTLGAHEAPVYSVAFSPDGQYLASGAFDKQVLIWSTRTGQLARKIDVPSGVFETSFSPDGQYLAAALGDGYVCIADWKAA